MIDITFTLSKSEYVEAQRLYIHANHRRTRLVRTVFFGAFFIAAAVTITSLASTLAGHATALLIAALLTWFLIHLNGWTQGFVLGTRFAIESKVANATHLHIDTYLYNTDLPASPENTLNWQLFTDWFEGPTVFTVIADRNIRPIPKRLLSAGQQDELRSLLQRCIPNSAVR